MTQSLLAIDTTPPAVHTDVRRKRLVYYFDSADSAYKWAWSHMPKYPPGAVCVCPPRAKKEDGEYILRYTVTHSGHVRYYTLLKNGVLMEE